MAAVFGPSQDGESENPRNVSDGSFALIGEAPFFGYFLWQDKESNSPQGESSCKQFKVNTIALKGEHRRCESKKVTKEKGLLEQGRSAVGK